MLKLVRQVFVQKPAMPRSARASAVCDLPKPSILHLEIHRYHQHYFLCCETIPASPKTLLSGSSDHGLNQNTIGPDAGPQRDQAAHEDSDSRSQD